MSEINSGGTQWTGSICPKCGKPYYYVGDVPNGGFVVGLEPYCTCGTEICGKCGQRYTPKCNHEPGGLTNDPR
jgi:hypothetical protein